MAVCIPGRVRASGPQHAADDLLSRVRRADHRAGRRLPLPRLRARDVRLARAARGAPEEAPEALNLRRCTGCDRVETTAANKKERRWERGDRDTDELLAVLLRRVKAQLFGKKALDLVDGLSAGLKAGDPLALRDARLVWTEPHSRRLKLEVDVAHASVRQRLLLEFVEERCKCAGLRGRAARTPRADCGKAEKPKNGQGRRRLRRAGSNKSARRLLRADDAVARGRDPAIGKTGLAFGAARLPRGKGLDVDFAQEKDGDRFVDELRRAGRAPLRVASKTRKLVTHVATRAENFHAVDAAHRSMCPHRTRRPTPWSTRRPSCWRCRPSRSGTSWSRSRAAAAGRPFTWCRRSGARYGWIASTRAKRKK